MSTERQRLANQKNAQKSTGPKTTEGKERSRRNALRHGLTGDGTVLKKTDAELFRKKLGKLREECRPVGELEQALVAKMALSIVRQERCIEKDLADLERRKRRAEARWEDRREDEVREGIALLKTEPSEAVDELEASSLGCAWLIEQWQKLARALMDQKFWDREQAKEACRLLGMDP